MFYLIFLLNHKDYSFTNLSQWPDASCQKSTFDDERLLLTFCLKSKDYNNEYLSFINRSCNKKLDKSFMRKKRFMRKRPHHRQRVLMQSERPCAPSRLLNFPQGRPNSKKYHGAQERKRHQRPKLGYLLLASCSWL